MFLVISISPAGAAVGVVSVHRCYFSFKISVNLNLSTLRCDQQLTVTVKDLKSNPAVSSILIT